jgi:dihydroorotate dehydrogenase electron transfer subunit
MKLKQTAILINKPYYVSKEHYLLKIRIPGASPAPGQFINIRIGTGTDPLLRRPFSVYNYSNGIIDIIMRVVGKGTDILKNHDPGNIDVIGPLGKGFTLEKNSNVLLVGGGVGAAPLYFLARELNARDCKVTFIFGASNREFIYCEEAFSSVSEKIIFTTDDGTYGEKGIATDVMKNILKDNKLNRIYTCGPFKMMESVFLLGKDHEPVEISMENYYGCGVGVCAGCTVMTKDGYKRACIDGPVFNGADVFFEK